LRLFYQPHALGVLNRLATILQVQPLDDLAHVILDRAFRQAQFCSNFFVGQTLCDKG